MLINATKVDDTTRFEYVSNPKRPGFKAHARYEAYQSSTSLVEYRATCEEIGSKAINADLRYDEEHGFLKLYNDEDELLNPKEA